jgi:NADH-quinone oxidoreductase subunit J
MASLQQVLVYAFAALALVGACGFVVYRQPVHAALSFAVAVLSCAGLYLMQGAAYAAVSTVIVYAGATIIIFLFALMFSQRSKLQVYDLEKSNPIISLAGSAALVAVLSAAALSFTIPTKLGTSPQAVAKDAATANPVDKVTPDETSAKAALTNALATNTTAVDVPGTDADAVVVSKSPRVADLGRVMYTRYLWAIEVAGAILLVATLGAIQIAREELSPNLQPENPTP